MTELLNSGLDWLHDQLKEHDSRSVTYRRAGQSDLTITAVVRSTTFELADDSGGLITIKSRDFIVQQDDLVIGGSETKPARGDKIIDEDTYEVMTLNDEPHYREDPYKQTFRIHTKLVTVA